MRNLSKRLQTGRLGCGLLLILALVVTGAPAAAAPSGDWPLVQRVETPDFVLDSQGVHVPGSAQHITPGAPQLPVKGLLIELPLEGDWQVSFRSIGSSVLPQRVDLAPAPSPVLDLNLPEGWMADLEALPSAVPLESRPDPAIYQADAFYPASPLQVGEPQRQGNQRLLPIQVFPFQYNPVTRELRYHPDVEITVRVERSDAPPTRPAQPDGFYQPATLPGSGVLRIHTQARGLYRLTYDDLHAAGVALGPGGEDPASFAIYYKGQPVDSEVTGAGDGQFDPGDLVIFYAVPYDGGRYQDYNIYHFVYGGGVVGPRMATRALTAATAPPTASVITKTLHIEYNRDYRSLYPRPNYADHFFDTQLFVTSDAPVQRDYDLALEDPVIAGGVVQIKALIHGGQDLVGANPDNAVRLSLNDHEVGVYRWNGRVEREINAAVPAAWLDSPPNQPNQVRLVAARSLLSGVNRYWISPDWVKVSYPAVANAASDRLYVEGLPNPAGQVAVSGFSSPSLWVIDVRNPAQPQRLSGFAVQQADDGSYQAYWDETVANPTYVLAAGAGLRAPSAVERDLPSNWADPSHAYDYVAIVGTERSAAGTTALGSQLAAAVQPLLDQRAAEGFSVALVPVQDIYDEWSFGRLDPSAIRSFLSYAYFNWATPPQYVLLVGDGHFDFNRVTNQRLPMLLPPYLIDIDPWIGETAADNRYVSVDSPNDFLPNMAIGRIPAVSAADVTAVVDKTLAYEDPDVVPDGLWQQRAVYVADDYADPAGNFHQLSDDVRLVWLPAAYEDRKIYYRMDADHDTGAEMLAAVTAAFNQGSLFTQWFGHGSVLRWGAYSAWSIWDVASLQPNPYTPFTLHNSCWSGYFIANNPNLDGQSLGERMVLAPGRGSVVDLSPSGLHIGSALKMLDVGLHYGMFDLRIPRAGDAVDYAKLFFFQASSYYYDLLDTMIYFGDPALKLRYPTGDLASSTLDVDEAVAPQGWTLDYTVTVSNSSIFTTSYPLVVVDYPEELVAVVAADGASDDGETLTWGLPDMPAGSTETLTFTLQAAAAAPPEGYNVVVPATISSQMAPSVTLHAQTLILPAPSALDSDLTANGSWLPPGSPLLATLALSHDANVWAPGVQATMTLPSELGAPTWLSASTGSLVYDPAAHRLTWSDRVPAGAATTLAFSSVISPTLTTCGALSVQAEVSYDGSATPHSVTVNLLVPDVDCDGSVTVIDIQQVAELWGAQAGNGLYDPRYDLNADGVIDIVDIMAVARAWN